MSTFSGGITRTNLFPSINTTVPSSLTVALAGAGAGNVDNGIHYYVVVFYDAYGRSVPSASVSVNVVDKTTNGQVSITNIPTSSKTGVIGRKIYRSATTGTYTGSGRYYLLTTIADNTTTTYTDNIADSTINVVTNDCIFTTETFNPFAGSTWDATTYYGGKTLSTIDSNKNTLFYDTTYNNPFMFIDVVNGRLKFGSPERPKITAQGSNFNTIYVGRDVSNTAIDAMYIMPAQGTRLHVGSSSAQIYSVNWAGVGLWENVPAYLQLQASANTHSFAGGTVSAIASSGNKNLALTTASGTSGVYISSGGNPSSSSRVFPFITYANNTDSFNWTGSHYYYNTNFDATASGTSFPYHTKWLSAGSLLGGLKMSGVFQIPRITPIVDSTTAIQFLKADGSTVVGTIDTTNSRFGLGTVSPTYKLHISETDTTAGGTRFVTGQYGIYNPSTNDTTVLYAVGDYKMSKIGANSAGSLRGLRTTVENGGGGNISTAISNQAFISNVGTGTIADGRAFYATKTASASNPITNMYGLYMDDMSGAGVTNAYGIYQLGANTKNYFAGNIGIGTSTPSTTLDVIGTITATNGNITGNLSYKNPHGAYSSTQTQTLSGTSTATVMTFNYTDDSYLITKTGDTNFSVARSGGYNFIISAITSASLANRHVEIWARKNGVNIPRSNTRIEKPISGEGVVAVPLHIDMNTTDVVQIMWASEDDAGMTLKYTTNTSYSPESPSVIMTVTRIGDLT
jgi:hypothetical protein